MKNKFKLIISLILISILIIGIGIFVYFKVIGIKSKIPEREENYNISINEYIGRSVFTVTPKNKETNGKVILYLHGGAYVGELGIEHWNFVGNLTNDTNSTIVLPDYPLAPKYTYKDVFNMIEPLYKEIVDKVGAQNVILMGDSAGGGMSLALLEKIALESEYEMPSKTILISPWLDVRLTNPEIDKVQKNDKELNKESLKLAGIAYAGNNGINNYLVNPIDGDLSKLKNITIFTGTYDILNPDVHVFEEKAKNQGTDIKVKEYEKAGHIWIVNQKGDKKLIEKAYQDLLEVVNYTKS